MDAERYQQIRRIYHTAIDLAPALRDAFLAEACAGEAKLRAEVESLLAMDQESGSFLASTALDEAARQVAEQRYLLIGREIGHYRILSWLGAGGMGEVFLAEDAKLGRKTALKFLPVQFTSDAERLRRFEREAKAASALTHPNIITIYEIGEAPAEFGKLHFIAAEYVDGQTLRQRMAAGKLPVELVIEAGAQIADALAAAHDAGIIHRDIKPENIMLHRNGYVKVLDFGLAKLTEPQIAESDVSEYTAVNASLNPAQSSEVLSTAMGTAGYMSPEQAGGLRVDTRADLFSLGVVLYEMIAGCAPFTGKSNSETAHSILFREAIPLAQLAPDVPSELPSIVTRALHKDRDARYQSAAEMRNDLKALKARLEANAVLSAHADSSLDSGLARRARWMGKTPFIVIAVLLLVITLTITIWRIYFSCPDCHRLGNVEWQRRRGNIISNDGALILHHEEQKSEMEGVEAFKLDCTFEATFHQGLYDSSAGLENWAPNEYSLTFRGGALRIVSDRTEMKTVPIESYAGRRMRIHLQASSDWLRAEIDGRIYLDEKNTYWNKIRLKPRLNATESDTITLHSSTCLWE